VQAEYRRRDLYLLGQPPLDPLYNQDLLCGYMSFACDMTMVQMIMAMEATNCPTIKLCRSQPVFDFHFQFSFQHFNRLNLERINAG
jgi:hypothetical protein